MAKTVKGLQSEVKKLKAKIDALKAKSQSKPRCARRKKAPVDASKAKKLTIYKVRLMLDETQVGIFGPYATIRAAAADAKNILRMHVGPGFKIEEIGVDEPVLRSDGKIMAYFHPSIYSAQATDKGVLTAQVVEQGGEAKREATFLKKYNPRRNGALKWTTHLPFRGDKRANYSAKGQGGTFIIAPVSGGWSVKWEDAMTTARIGVYSTLTDAKHAAANAVVADDIGFTGARKSRSNPQKTFKTRSGQVVSFFAKK